MSEPGPVPQPHDPAASPTEPDPLLDPGAFIDPDRNDGDDAAAESPENHPLSPPHHPNVGFAPGVVIAAEPISILRPGETEVEPNPRAKTPAKAKVSAKRRSMEEAMKKPDWLPEGWEIEPRIRASGATAGQIDRYFVEPTGQRKFRSRVEVFHFLENGEKLKRKPTPAEADGTSGSAPASQKQKKSSAKRNKSETLNSDISQPTAVNGT